MTDYHHHYFGVSKWNMYSRFTSNQCWACVALSINNILHIVLVIYRCLQVARHCTAIVNQCIDQERMSWVVYSIQGYSTIMFPFMPGPILILVSMTSVMIIVLITNGYRGYERGITSYDFLFIYRIPIIVTFVAKS